MRVSKWSWKCDLKMHYSFKVNNIHSDTTHHFLLFTDLLRNRWSHLLESVFKVNFANPNRWACNKQNMVSWMHVCTCNVALMVLGNTCLPVSVWAGREDKWTLRALTHASRTKADRSAPLKHTIQPCEITTFLFTTYAATVVTIKHSYVKLSHRMSCAISSRWTSESRQGLVPP